MGFDQAHKELPLVGEGEVWIFLCIYIWYMVKWRILFDYFQDYLCYSTTKEYILSVLHIPKAKMLQEWLKDRAHYGTGLDP